MYDEWPFVTFDVFDSYVNKPYFVPHQISKQVLSLLSKEISGHYGNSSDSGGDGYKSPILPHLDTEAGLRWYLECARCGIKASMQSDYDTIRDGVRLYSAWLNNLFLPKSEVTIDVPRPIQRSPVAHVTELLAHVQSLFTNNYFDSQTNESFLRKAKECHAILRCCENLPENCPADYMEPLTDVLLKFMLTVNNQLLAPTFKADDLSDQLSQRLIVVLFQLWMKAIASSHATFPSPSFWKTLQNYSAMWRHRKALVVRWSEIVKGLTMELILRQNGDHDMMASSVAMENVTGLRRLTDGKMAEAKCLHAWFRFLYLIERCGASFTDPKAETEDSDGTPIPMTDSHEAQAQNLVSVVNTYAELVHLFCSLERDQTQQSSSIYPTFAPDRPSVNSLCFLLQDIFADVTQKTTEMLKSVGADRSSLAAIAPTAFASSKFDAVTALTNIFMSTKAGEAIRAEYLARFYCIAEATLKTDPSMVIICHMARVLRSNMIGCEILVMLILDYVKSVVLLGGRPFTKEVIAETSTADWIETLTLVSSFANDIGEPESASAVGRALLHCLKQSNVRPLDTQRALAALGQLLASCEQARNPEESSGKFSNLTEECVAVILDQLPGAWLTKRQVCFCALNFLTLLTHLIPRSRVYKVGGATKVKLVDHLCRFAEAQLSRPPTEHSRELHSVIVDTYMCIARWICMDPGIMRSQGVIRAIFAIVELGILGTRPRRSSISKDAEVVSAQPASRRVRDGAEVLLNVLYRHSTLRPCQTVKTSSLPFGETFSRTMACADNCLFVRMADSDRSGEAFVSLTGVQDQTDWRVQLRFDPKPPSEITSPQKPTPEVRVPMVVNGGSRPNPVGYFPLDPPGYEPCKAELTAMRPLTQLLHAYDNRSVFQTAVTKATEEERVATSRLLERSSKFIPCLPPKVCESPDTGRLWVTSVLSDPCNLKRRLRFANSDDEQLRNFSSLPVCPTFTVPIFYLCQEFPVHPPRISPFATCLDSVCGSFLKLLSRLGERCEFEQKAKSEDVEPLLWKEWFCELKFVPALSNRGFGDRPPSSARIRSVSSPKSPSSELRPEFPVPPPRNRAQTQDSSLSKEQHGLTRASSVASQSYSIAVLWTEDLEFCLSSYLSDICDQVRAIDQKGSSTSNGFLNFHVLFVLISPLPSGYYRVYLAHIRDNCVEDLPFCTLPIGSGSVVSEAALAVSVRETIFQILWRLQIEQDTWLLPQAARKSAGQDIIKCLSVPEFELPEYLCFLVNRNSPA